MKKNLLKKCAMVSSVGLAATLCLYAYVWIFDPNPKMINHAQTWSKISMGAKKSLLQTNGLPAGTYVYDGGGILHISVTKLWGGNLVFFNQNIPYTGSIFRFTGDNTINMTGRTGFGIYYRHITHTIEKDKDWWTLMVSLWYPIIAFCVLPALLALKQLWKGKQIAKQ